jgi:ADP-ribose pyrophosphatase YjhB (NUDIX family)
LKVKTQARGGARKANGADAVKRRYPAGPVVGVGAIVVKRGKILLVRRGRAPLKGYWSLPGGVLRTGERLRDGVRREVREETGLEVEPLGVFEVFERILADGRGRTRYHYVLVDYLCRVQGGELRAADDAESARWVASKELGRYPMTEGTLEVIRRAMRKGRRKLLRG